MVRRGAEGLVGTFAHHDDAYPESLGVFYHRREVAVVRDEDQGRGRGGAGHQLDRVDREAHVGGVLAGGIAALVDELEFGPFLGGGPPAAEAALEVAVGLGGGDRRLADEAAEGGEVLVGHVVRVDQHPDALVGLGFGGFQGRSGGGVGLTLRRLGCPASGGLGASAGGGGLLGFGSGHGRGSPYPCGVTPRSTMRNPRAPRGRGVHIIWLELRAFTDVKSVCL